MLYNSLVARICARHRKDSKMKLITVALLQKHSACADQVALFKKVFPKGAPLTTKAVETALKRGLSVSWLSTLLSLSAWAEYKRVTAPAWAEYERVTAPASAEYKRVI